VPKLTIDDYQLIFMQPNMQSHFNQGVHPNWKFLHIHFIPNNDSSHLHLQTYYRHLIKDFMKVLLNFRDHFLSIHFQLNQDHRRFLNLSVPKILLLSMVFDLYYLKCFHASCFMMLHRRRLFHFYDLHQYLVFQFPYLTLSCQRPNYCFIQ